MVELPYKHILQIMDLIDAKIDDLQKNRYSSIRNQSSMPIFDKIHTDAAPGEFIKEEVEEDTPATRFDKEISEYEHMKNLFESELEKIKFRFGAEERWNQNKQQNNPQNQEK